MPTSGVIRGVRQRVTVGAGVPGVFPGTAEEMRIATAGYGTWASAWRCDEQDGALADSIGGIALSPLVTPYYRESGPIDGKFSVAFDHSVENESFEAASATTYDLGAATSIALYACFRVRASVNRFFMSKNAPSGVGQWGIVFQSSDGTIYGNIFDGTNGGNSIVAGNHLDGRWHDAIFCIDRASQVMQMFTDMGAGPAYDTTPVGTLTNASPFRLGAPPSGTTLGIQIAFAAVATGDVVNLRLNAPQAIASMRRYTARQP